MPSRIDRLKADVDLCWPWQVELPLSPPEHVRWCRKPAPIKPALRGIVMLGQNARNFLPPKPCLCASAVPVNAVATSVRSPRASWSVRTPGFPRFATDPPGGHRIDLSPGPCPAARVGTAVWRSRGTGTGPKLLLHASKGAQRKIIR